VAPTLVVWVIHTEKFSASVKPRLIFLNFIVTDWRSQR
jgi:hypothetical protein